jgi:hypothetical protein
MQRDFERHAGALEMGQIAIEIIAHRQTGHIGILVEPVGGVAGSAVDGAALGGDADRLAYGIPDKMAFRRTATTTATTGTSHGMARAVLCRFAECLHNVKERMEGV